MRKYLLLLFSLCILPLSAQNSAEKLLQKTVSKIQKDGGIAMTLDAEIKYEHGTDRVDITLKMSDQGFSVSGNGSDTFTLTASNAERSVEGIRSVTVQVDPATLVFKTLSISFAEELGNISARILVTDYKAGQSFDKKTFTCPVSDYKDAEIVDLR